MRRIVFFFISAFVCLGDLCAQENSSITNKLKEKYKYVFFSENHGGWYRVSKKELSKDVGACDKNGKLVIPCKYTDVYYDGNGYEVKTIQKAKNIDTKDDALSKAYYHAMGISINKKEEYKTLAAYCDKNGKIVIPFKYSWISADEQGYSVKNSKTVLKRDQSRVGTTIEETVSYEGRLNKDGKEIIPCRYKMIYFDRNDSLFHVKSDALGVETEGLYSLNGEEIVPCIYKDIMNLKRIAKSDPKYYRPKPDGYNYFIVKDTKDEKGVLDAKGHTIHHCHYERISISILWEYGLILGESKDGECDLLDNKGNSLIQMCDFITPFPYKSEKTGLPLFTVKKYGLYALVNDKGEELTKFEYSSIDSGSEGLFKCKKGDGDNARYGFIDEEGKLIIPLKYEKASSFHDGVAQVTENGVTSLLTNPLGETALTVNGGNGKVDTNIPETKKTCDDVFAFIFANENYLHLPNADFAINDGKVFREYCHKTFGIPDKNIRYYENATFGNLIGAVQKIQDIAEVYDGEARIIIYYSGLGTSDQNTKERYLLPSDASLSTLQSTGYKLSTLTEMLNNIATKMTLLIIDAPFNGTDKGGKTLASSRGIVILPKDNQIKGNIVICMGCDKNETAYADKSYGHGLFTYAILDQLQSTKGNTSIKKIMDDASNWVKQEVLNKYDSKQTPKITVSEEMINKFEDIKF